MFAANRELSISIVWRAPYFHFVCLKALATTIHGQIILGSYTEDYNIDAILCFGISLTRHISFAPHTWPHALIAPTEQREQL